MQNSEQKRLRQRSSFGTVDGFIRPQISRRPIILERPPNVVQRPVVKVPSEPVRASTLNMALPPAAASTKVTQPKKVYRKVIKRTLLSAVLIVLVAGGLLGAKGLFTINKVFHGNVISDATAAFDDSPLKGESSGRVNILLAGDSVDDPDHAGAQLTDSILILSIDTKDNTAFLLSVPRDLWVYVPGLSSYQKINAANNVTSFSQPGFPKGGMGQLEEIIENNLGIPIDYYGLMDYGAFKDSVDAVDGVSININSPDPRGLYDPNADLKLPNGPVALNGQEALNLARARGDGYGSYGFPQSDFDRTEHQRQLFIAVASKAKTLGVLTDPLKISDLISTLGNNFQTDLSLQNVLRLIQVTKGINPTSIQSYAFSSSITSSGTTPVLQNYTDPSSGEEALIPTDGIGDYGQLQQYYDQLTSSNPVVRENPSVVILNASDVVGLAHQQVTKLQQAGFNVPTVADANNEYPTTMIIDNTAGAKPNSLSALQKLYPGTTVTSSTGSPEAKEAQGYSSNFVVILGQNWDNSASATSAQ